MPGAYACARPYLLCYHWTNVEGIRDALYEHGEHSKPMMPGSDNQATGGGCHPALYFIFIMKMLRIHNTHSQRQWRGNRTPTPAQYPGSSKTSNMKWKFFAQIKKKMAKSPVHFGEWNASLECAIRERFPACPNATDDNASCSRLLLWMHRNGWWRL